MDTLQVIVILLVLAAAVYVAGRIIGHEDKQMLELRKQEKAEEPLLADAWEQNIQDKIYKHRFNLLQEIRRCTSSDAYGNEETTWYERGCELHPNIVKRELEEYNNRIFNNGLGYFWRHVILESPYDAREFFRGWKAFVHQRRPDSFVGNQTIQPGEWFYYLAYQVDCVTSALASSNPDIDDMTGIEYEQYCQQLFEINGWDVEVTPKTGDQGVDLIGNNGSYRLCIQCKRYSKPVGNSAVQQIAAGKVHYNGSDGAVVTNAGFTSSARELADSTGILLLSTEEFAHLINTDKDDEESQAS